MFFGSDAFSSRVLASPSLSEHLVTCASDQDAWLRSLSTPVQPLRLEEPLWGIDVASYDLALVASFGKLVPELPGLPSYNLHPSLLPRWRGAAPAEWTVAAGDEVAGVTLQTLARRFDEGRIVWQKCFDLPRGSTPDWLLQEAASVADEGLRLLLSSEEGQLQTREQDERLVTLAPKPTREHSRVQWAEWTPDQVVNRHLAMHKRHHLHTRMGKRAFLLEVAHTDDQEGDAPAGTVERRPGRRVRVRANGGWVELVWVQQEGKARQTAADFCNGYLHKAGRSLLFT